MMQLSKVIVRSPTSMLLGPVKRADPWTTSTLRWRARPSRPPVSLSTTDCFQERSASRSTLRLVEVDAVGAHLLRLGDHPRGVQQAPSTGCSRRSGRRRRAARSARQDRLEAEVGGAERGRVAARPGSEHEHLRVVVGLARRRGWGRRRTRAAVGRRSGASRWRWGRRRGGLGGAGGGGRLGAWAARRMAAVGRPPCSPGSRASAARCPPTPGRRSPTLSCVTVPANGRRDVHRRLVGLERDQRVLGLDLVAGRDVDLDHRHVGEIPDVGDADFGDLGHSSARRRSESTPARCTTNRAAAAPSITRWS